MTLHPEADQSASDDTARAQRAAVRAHSSQAPPSDETVHTTANHPWLTADRGWVQAGQLQSGEPVVTLSGGSSGTVAWVHGVPGQADMYNLTVANDHTYAVGDGRPRRAWHADVGGCRARHPPTLDVDAMTRYNKIYR